MVYISPHGTGYLAVWTVGCLLFDLGQVGKSWDGLGFSHPLLAQ